MNCCICNDKHNIITKLNCNHKFCVMCISKWYLQNNTCPLCRNRYNIELLTPNYYIDSIKTRSQKKEFNEVTFLLDLIKFTHFINRLQRNHRSEHYINGEMICGFDRIIMKNIEIILKTKHEWIKEILEYLFILKKEYLFGRFLVKNRGKYSKLYRYIKDNLDSGNKLPI